ncbi:MAG: response regulator, partial [Clostridiales bacterium]|nr:response regulator [Clostridiales bacterium]
MSKNRSKIIFVDDVMSNLDQGRNILKAFYEVYPALSAHKLFEILENVVPDLILLDIEMPEVNGYEAMKMLKKDSRFADIPVIFVTAKNDESSEREGFDLGAVDYITKPFSAPLLLKRIENQLLIRRRTLDLQASQSALQEYADNLTTMVSEKTEEIMELQSVILSTIGDLVEFRDNPTGGHVSRTYRYMRILVDGVCNSGLDYKEQIAQWNLDYFLQSAQLHDVGKITISDLILGKPAKLTSDEFEIMKSHVLAGVEA